MNAAKVVVLFQYPLNQAAAFCRIVQVGAQRERLSLITSAMRECLRCLVRSLFSSSGTSASKCAQYIFNHGHFWQHICALVRGDTAESVNQNAFICASVAMPD